MPKKHISQQKASSDIPEYLLPPHPSERNSLRPPLPLHIVSNPRHLPPPAGATADGLVNPDHVSLQEFCPALSQQLQGQHGSSRSTSTAALHHTSVERSKTLRGDSHTRDSGPLVEGIKKTITQHSCNACQIVCTAAISSYGSPHMPPLNLGVSN